MGNSITLDLKQQKKQLTDEIKGSEALIHKQKFSGGLYSDYSRLVKPLQLLVSTTLSGELKVSLPVMSSIVAALWMGEGHWQKKIIDFVYV